MEVAEGVEGDESQVLDLSWLRLEGLHWDSLSEERRRDTQRLLLSHNRLTYLPGSVALFRNLQLLDVSNNGLAFLCEEVLRLTRLRTLLAKNNQLTEFSLPKDFGHMGLEVVNLSGNRFEEMPSQLLELHGLRSLSLGGNRLKTIPPEIENLTSIHILQPRRSRIQSLKALRFLIRCLEALQNQDRKVIYMPRSLFYSTVAAVTNIYRSPLYYTFVGISLWSYKKMHLIGSQAAPPPKRSLFLKIKLGGFLCFFLHSHIIDKVFFWGGGRARGEPLIWLSWKKSIFVEGFKEIIFVSHADRSFLFFFAPSIYSLNPEVQSLLNCLISCFNYKLTFYHRYSSIYKNVNSSIADDIFIGGKDLSFLTCFFFLDTSFSLELLYLGGNHITSIPPELANLPRLSYLVLCDNRIQGVPPQLAQLHSLRSLSLHNNLLTFLPREILHLVQLQELSLRGNPLVVRFVRDLTYDPPSLLEMAGRAIKSRNVPYTPRDLPENLIQYLDLASKCPNPKCAGVYFDSCVRQIKFVDFCGKYRLPLMHYLCSPECSSPCGSNSQSDCDSEDEVSVAAHRMQKVLLG
uniref:Leucine rich repeat containing 58 n=1 Tax=Latimeria chalumnae TaxID=7897 RepID=H3B2D6_LATCH